MDCSTPGFPVLHYLLEFAQTHSLVAQLVKNPPTVQVTLVRSLGREDPLEKGMTEDETVGWHHQLDGYEFE